MKFDKLIKRLYTEALGDLPERSEDPTMEAPGARRYHLIPKADPELTAAMRGKGRELTTGQIEKNKLDAPRAAVGSAFNKFITNDFNPANEIQQREVEKYKSWGMDETVAYIFYLMGAKIFRNIATLEDLNVPDQEKLILLPSESDEPDYVSPQEIAKQTLEHFLFIFDEYNFPFKKQTDGKIHLPYKEYNETTEQKNNRLAWKELIDALRWQSGSRRGDTSEFAWDFTTQQSEAKRNYFALDARSTENNWIIYTRGNKEESKVISSNIRIASGSLTRKSISFLTSDKPTEQNGMRNTLPLLFVNGVPKYGQQLNSKQVENITLGDFLNLVGHEVIWDVIYAKCIAKDTTFTLSDGTILDLNNITISHYDVSKSSKISRERAINVAKTANRNKIDTSLNLPKPEDFSDLDDDSEEETPEEDTEEV
jgi:hypothetical protein